MNEPVTFRMFPARECACGAGMWFKLGPFSRAEAARLVAERRVLFEATIASEEDIDKIETPGFSAGWVQCHSCGSLAPATHWITWASNVGFLKADELTEASAAGYAAIDAEAQRRAREELGPIQPEVPDALPEDI